MRAIGLAPSLRDIISCGNVSNWGTCCNEPPCGQLNIASSHMLAVLRNITKEVAALFDDNYYHLGYDEINFNCWAKDNSIQQYLQQHNMTIHQLLLQFYEQQVDMLNGISPSKTRLYWEEAAMQEPALPLDEKSKLLTFFLFNCSKLFTSTLFLTNIHTSHKMYISAMIAFHFYFSKQCFQLENLY